MLSPFYAQNLKRLDYSRNVLNAYADVPFLSFFFSFSPLPVRIILRHSSDTHREERGTDNYLSTKWWGLEMTSEVYLQKSSQNLSACPGESVLPAKMRKTPQERHKRGQCLNPCHISMIHIIKSVFTTADESASSHTTSILFPPKNPAR